MNQNMSTNTSSYGIYIAGAVVITAVLFFTAFLLFLGKMDMALKTNAIEQCGKLSFSEQKIDDGKSTVRYPLQDFYTKCLDKAGVK